MVHLLAALIVLTCTSPAFAGAWLREKGAGFSSVTGSATIGGDIAESSYLEFGARDDLTFGVEIGFTGFATAFLRRPIGKNDKPGVWAYELGMGVGWTDYVIRPYLLTGLSWGRGYDLGGLNGWLAVDTSVTWDVYFAEHLVKIDSTLGMNFGDRFSGMLQLFGAGTAAGHTTSIAPSILVTPLNNHPEIRLQIGGQSQIGLPANSAIKVSIWRSF
jgi:hypothetical protein